MHFFSVVSACLLFSSLAAAGPLPRDRLRKLQFRQVAPFKNTTSTTDSVVPTIEVVPVPLSPSGTPVDTATALLTATEITASSSDLSTALTSTISSTSGFADTTSPSSSTATTTAADVTIITPTSPTATAAGDGADTAQTEVSASQTAKGPTSSNLSGYLPSGSIVGGTGNFSRTLVSANSNTEAFTDSKPTTGSQAFPFAETLTNTPDAPSTTAEAPFTFSSDPVTPTTQSTRTTNAPVLITVSGVGSAIPFTPSFFSSASPLPTTTDAPTTTAGEPIIKVPTAITAGQNSIIPTASLAAVVAKNRDQANYYNDVFRTLTPDSRCEPNSIACIDGSLATCEDGSYVLGECRIAGTACFAIPLQKSEGVYVNCESIETAERLLGLPNSLSVTIGSVPVVVPSTTSEQAVQVTSVVDPGPTTTAADAAVTAAAVHSSDSDESQAEADEETTVLHTTLISTITIAISDFAPSTVAPAADATAAAVADGSLISIVPVAAAAAAPGGSGDRGQAGKEEGGPVTVTVTRSVTVTEQVTVTKAGMTATVTMTERV